MKLILESIKISELYVWVNPSDDDDEMCNREARRICKISVRWWLIKLRNLKYDSITLGTFWDRPPEQK